MAVPQVLGEFKAIRSGLDAKQARKGSTRSPVEQCFDYLHAAWQSRDRDALVGPFFALVTDMNEFRLYARRLGRGQFQRFVLAGPGTAAEPALLDDTPAAAFRRFVFWRMLRPDMLLVRRAAPALDRLLRDQIVREKAIEKDFYREYRDYRQFVYRTLVKANPAFNGTRGQLVRLTQRFLDLCIFILFCEDMGRVLRYPPALLREILIEKSQSRFYDPEGSGPWDELRALFRAMRDGGNFGSHPIDRFNGGLFDQDSIIRSILSHNIYGVDLNQESVEITKLALWLHTAAPGKPLCSLNSNIRCGNSLVGPDFAEFYRHRHQTLFDQADGNERERINAFDWHAAFPEVFSHGGFDCVIGNPPYIKLQHFRRAQEDVAAYLVEARKPDGSPLYASTQSGNFDMYLPFIEKGVRLLKPEGRMGYIAPNFWMVNKYGKPLRQLVRQNRSLDRWLDFKSHQTFDEAITYTALQFFRGSPADALTCAFAPDGNAAAVDWQKADRVPFEELPQEDAWTLAPKAEMELIGRLSTTCARLDDPKWTRQIFQGLITSADAIYHLKRIASNAYQTHDGRDVTIEDALMHPLVSGAETKRYQTPLTKTHILFPYDAQPGQRSRLFSPDEMTTRFPAGWAYLKFYETDLRKRENGKLDDEEWYRFGRNQSIDKQEFPKLLVPRLITRLFCAMDLDGACYLDNVDVGGILCEDAQNLPYLAAMLNAPVCNFVWRRISKPFQNDYRSANKQFIAPLPIPDATPAERAEVGARARELQELHTLRRDTIAKLHQRLHSAQTAPLTPAPKEDWLWAEVGTAASWKHSPEVPPGLTGRALTAWAKEKHAAALQQRLDALDALLQPGATVTVSNTDDELALHLSGREALRLYGRPDTPFLAAQWRHALRDLNITAAFDAKRLLKLLLTLRTTADDPLKNRILALDHEITTLDQTLATKEAELNAIIYGLYRLTPEEVGMVENG